jgi:putative ABC transport system ATP-binding protein
MLRLHELRKTYRRADGRNVEALRGPSLDLASGDFVAVEGPSGCGKSTLLLTAGLLQRPDGGQVLWEGHDVYRLGREERARFRRRHIGFVFQQFHLIPYLTLLDNIRLPDLVEEETDGEARARELAAGLGLSDRLAHVPGELSVGERQRVALARALYGKPRLLLADEPTGNLDGESAARVLDGLADFAAAGGMVLLVTHDARAAERARKRLRMRDGRFEAEGKA